MNSKGFLDFSGTSFFGGSCFLRFCLKVDFLKVFSPLFMLFQKRMALDKDNTLKKEADIMRHVSKSVHVASLVECYEDDQCVHFIMELCTGGMLYDSITAKGHYSEKQAASMLRNMVQIVQDLHNMGVIHRDLKLENFLLASNEENAQLKVIDFGLSTFFTPGQKFAKIVGSAYYVAPEVIRFSLYICPISLAQL